jgi:hypothetical protein
MNNPAVDLSAPFQQFIITAGDDIEFALEVKVNGVIQNDAQLAGWTLACQVRDTATWATRGNLITVGNGCDIGDNKFNILISGENHTHYLRTAASLSYDVQLINPDGIKRTYLAGIITGSKDSTRT